MIHIGFRSSFTRMCLNVLGYNTLLVQKIKWKKQKKKTIFAKGFMKWQSTRYTLDLDLPQLKWCAIKEMHKYFCKERIFLYFFYFSILYLLLVWDLNLQLKCSKFRRHQIAMHKYFNNTNEATICFFFQLPIFNILIIIVPYDQMKNEEVVY